MDLKNYFLNKICCVFKRRIQILPCCTVVLTLPLELVYFLVYLFLCTVERNACYGFGRFYWKSASDGMRPGSTGRQYGTPRTGS